MALEINDNMPKNNEPAQTPPTPPPFQGNQGGNDIFADLDGVATTTQTGGGSMEGFQKFVEEMERRIKSPEVAGSIKLKMVPVFSKELNLPVVALTCNYNNTILVYSLLMEGLLSRPMQPIEEPVRGMGGAVVGTNVIDIPTARCYDTKLRDVVATTVAATLNVAKTSVTHVYYCVVPADADLSAIDVAATYYDTAQLALINTTDVEKRRSITATHLVSNSGFIKQTASLTPGGVARSRGGNPVACDFAIKMEVVKKASDNASIYERAYEVHRQPRTYLLAETSGYMDFIPVMDAPIKTQFHTNVQTRPGFMPVAVVTDISGLSHNGKTIENLSTQLLGLVNTLALLDDGQGWKRIFEKPPGSISSKKSIGLLGFEHDPFVGRVPEPGLIQISEVGVTGKATDGTMTAKECADLMCTDRVALAVDIEEGGRLSWVQSVFVLAAGATTDANAAARANREIIAECDRLTGSRFSPAWTNLNKGVLATVVQPRPVTVHLGTYRGPSGAPRDVRCIDYLSVLEDKTKEVETVAMVTKCQVPGLCNTLTMSDRRAYLKSVATDFKVTGLATRVFTSPGFISCLAQALREAGVTIRQENPLGYMSNNWGASVAYAAGDIITGSGIFAGGVSSTPQAIPVGGYVNPFI